MTWLLYANASLHDFWEWALSLTFKMSTQTSHDFDYIVVGGGTAGLVLAARLTENPALRVCILEAGEYVSNLAETMVPGINSLYLSVHIILNHDSIGFGFQNIGDPKIGWVFSSSPQPAANNRTVHLPR